MKSERKLLKLSKLRKYEKAEKRMGTVRRKGGGTERIVKRRKERKIKDGEGKKVQKRKEK